MLYIVRSGDTLGKIATQFKLPVSVLLAFNQQISDPNMLKVGQSILIPNVDDVPGAPKAVGVQAAQLITRARSAINKGIRYELGKGGLAPTNGMPDQSKKCDCSGFVCWILGLSRKTSLPFYQKFGGWIFTDSMVADVNSQAGIFESIKTREPGCIVVYGAGSAIGHVGIVSEVAGGQMKKVIHCSSGNDKKFSDSIQETGPAVFDRADTVWGRFSGLN